MLLSNNPALIGAHLHWTIDRLSRSFRIYTIEPDLYQPEQHSTIFDAAMRALVEPRPLKLSENRPANAMAPPERFDLATFPEAFLPQEHFLSTLAKLDRRLAFGCVHVGLRPRPVDDTHLFTVPELLKLVAAIKAFPDIINEDVEPFEDWLSRQTHSWMFNIGCMFTVDNAQRVRVCLHAKNIKSKFERKALAEKNMKEAGYISLVTLHSPHERFMRVTLQPVLCSDVLDLGTDSGDLGPLHAASQRPELFNPQPPDHIDIVSVATCTPQPRVSPAKGHGPLEWQEQFRSTFEHTATSGGLTRYRFASFVLANFRSVFEGEAGLSGIYLPARLRQDKYGSFIVISCWGRPNSGARNSWTPPSNDISGVKDWQILGYLACLDRMQDRDPPAGRMLGFSVDRLPRDMHQAVETTGLTVCEHWTGKPSEDGTEFRFSEQANA